VVPCDALPMMGDVALVRRPGPRVAEGIVTHIARSEVDPDLALLQWRGYVAALERCGWTPVEVAPADDCPDSVFVEDTMVVYGDLAVIARPGARQRRREVPAVESAVKARGYRTASVVEPGTLDGGDVLKVGATVFVGRGGRTNSAGIDQLRAHLTPLGARVVDLRVSKVLHLKSAVTALPDGTVVGYPPLVDEPAAFERFLEVPEEAGAHVVLLGQGRLLMSASAPASAEAFSALGYEPVVVEISEFEKLEGCVTCLSIRLRAGSSAS
jgi:dimethylargininase